MIVQSLRLIQKNGYNEELVEKYVQILRKQPLNPEPQKDPALGIAYYWIDNFLSIIRQIFTQGVSLTSIFSSKQTLVGTLDSKSISNIAQQAFSSIGSIIGTFYSLHRITGSNK
jgi:hypothetical protein